MIEQSDRDVFDLLVEAGNDMIGALGERDLEAFTDALDTRTRLIDHLRSLGAPPNVRENWHEMAQIITEQDRDILALAHKIQEEISAQLTQTSKIGHAARAYGPAGASSGMLHGTLRG
jgi:hypothetical protein